MPACGMLSQLNTLTSSTRYKPKNHLKIIVQAIMRDGKRAAKQSGERVFNCLNYDFKVIHLILVMVCWLKPRHTKCKCNHSYRKNHTIIIVQAIMGEFPQAAKPPRSPNWLRIVEMAPIPNFIYSCNLFNQKIKFTIHYVICILLLFLWLETCNYIQVSLFL
jgi:hypothetical protein